MPVGEQGWVQWLARRTGSVNKSVVAGIGDDCAIFRPKPNQDLLFTTDMLIEDVHFRRTTHTAADVGHKTLARGLSDIAAMGGIPQFCLVSVALPPWADDTWLKSFYRGFLSLAKRAQCPLIGGDFSHTPQFIADIVVCGAVPRGQALRRDGAKAGDQLYVSGRLGGSALGLEEPTGPAARRHRRPAPRLALGQELRELHATAAMDLSDGLSLDLQRLAAASGLAAFVERVPRYPGATLEQALHGGEDYELLFALPPRVVPPRTLGGVAISHIGELRAGPPGQVSYRGEPLAAEGYDHFRARYSEIGEPS